jgi:hypothetical protein
MSTINCLTNRKPMLHSFIIKYIHIIRDVKDISQASCAGGVCRYSLSTSNPQFLQLLSTETL